MAVAGAVTMLPQKAAAVLLLLLLLLELVAVAEGLMTRLW